jgi:hypothetical protein
MQLKAVVFDLAERKRSELIAGSLYSQGAETWLYNSKGAAKGPLWSEGENRPRGAKFDLLVLHNNNSTMWVETKCQATVTVRYTGGSSVLATERDDYWIQRPVTSGSPLTEDDAADILEWAEAFINGSAATLLPPILGGSQDEFALQVLNALFPFGLTWELNGKDTLLKKAGDVFAGCKPDANSFEQAVNLYICSRFVKGNYSWPAIYEKLTRRISRIISQSAHMASLTVTWERAGVSEPPENLDSALKTLAESDSWMQWNLRLTALRDTLLTK